MGIKIAILRGINVGGRRKIKMADLRAALDAGGYDVITTYIQSGNVIFRSDVDDHQKIAEDIEAMILREFGHEVPVVIRSVTEIEAAIRSNPFQERNAPIERLCLTFLQNEPDAEAVRELSILDFKPDEFVVDGNNVFLYCVNPYHKTKLSNNLFEKKLKVGATTRNWKTVLKLLELGNQ